MANGWAVIVALTFLTVCGANINKRNVSTLLYPDCAQYPSCKEIVYQNATASNVSFPNVVYVRSSAGKDVLHFVMTTVHLPSVLVVHTEGTGKEQLHFNWTRLLANDTADMEGAIHTDGSILYSFALTFSRLIEYDDIHDSASLLSAEKDNKTQWNIRSFSQFMWQNVTTGQGGNSIIFNTSYPQLAPYGNNTEGSMYFEFEINSQGGRDSDLPRLLYNANNTQMNFVLDKYIPKFNNSRFAVEMTIVGNHSSEAMTVDETRSIDDEFSPGVFRVVNWYTAGESQSKGYMQWKPVCYLDAERSRSVGTEVQNYKLTEPGNVSGLAPLLQESVAQAFFGKALNDSSKVMAMASNISFGLSQDGFYLKNNYTAWTASVGYGQPPTESISTLVIIIIAAGLGLPVIIILFGGIYVCVRRRRRNDYESLDGEVTRNNPRLN